MPSDKEVTCHCRECEREFTSPLPCPEFCSEQCQRAFYRAEANRNRDDYGRWNC